MKVPIISLLFAAVVYGQQWPTSGQGQGQGQSQGGFGPMPFNQFPPFNQQQTGGGSFGSGNPMMQGGPMMMGGPPPPPPQHRYVTCHANDASTSNNNNNNNIMMGPSSAERKQRACSEMLKNVAELMGLMPDPSSIMTMMGQNSQTSGSTTTGTDPMQQMRDQMKQSMGKACPQFLRTLDSGWRDSCCDVQCMCQEIQDNDTNNRTCGGKIPNRMPPMPNFGNNQGPPPPFNFGNNQGPSNFNFGNTNQANFRPQPNQINQPNPSTNFNQWNTGNTGNTGFKPQ